MSLLTIQQVAEETQLSTATIRRVIQRGELRASRLGAQWRIAPEAVEEWVNREVVP